MMKKEFDPFKLIMGILSLILAYFVMTRVGITVQVMVILVGIFMLVNGVIRFMGRNKLRKLGMDKTGWLTFSAILDILVGILVLVMPDFGIVYIWILLTIGLFMDSLFELWAARFVKESKGYYWFTIIFAIIGIVLAIIMMFSPALALTFGVALLGAYFMVYGIMEVVEAF
ncbi:hypothetical protein IV68_GL000011 [Weissella halotolerans DSM 20190]|uniref:Integral membrane protein n=2 Tax=Weissella halotolerans TaxID=1615 RepID=A0A0R2G989_9LACO|nr:hypothetical protein IV68_GL000011 [Weissella halotolerans DSM 20190]